MAESRLYGERPSGRQEEMPPGGRAAYKATWAVPVRGDPVVWLSMERTPPLTLPDWTTCPLAGSVSLSRLAISERDVAMTRCLRSAVGVWLFVGVLWAGAAEKGERFWEWGWGIYGGPVADVARYDWSMVNFGNDPADQRTLDRFNAILRINPKHKIAVRVWPIMGKGDCPENRHQATLFHYLYKEGVRERVLEETRRQLRLVIDGVTHPQNVVGSFFLEELPSHFTGRPFLKIGPDVPPTWDMVRFAKEIEGELGAPFDAGNAAHRLWWGQKYCAVLGEIHRTMKEASDGRLVLYWQATAFWNLDHHPGAETEAKARVLPFHYRDIVKPGVCDGFFGYPNSKRVWDTQTVPVVEELDCLFFSQLSTPAGMRLSKFETTVELARWRNPGNLGTFLYIQAGRGRKSWNELPYLDGVRYWTAAEHARRFAWDHKVGGNVVGRYLAPQVQLDYDARNKAKGDFVHVYAQVVNPRDASWFGGHERKALLRAVKVTLTVPKGFEIPFENSAPASITLGDLPARSCRVADWWVRVTGDGTMGDGRAFRIRGEAANSSPVEASYSQLNTEIPVLGTREVMRSGQRWVEPAYRLPRFEPAAELVSRDWPVAFPELRAEGRSVVYRGVLPRRHRLVIGPGLKALLFSEPLFDEAVRTFVKSEKRDGLAVFTTGYPSYKSPRLAVEPGRDYRVQVTGKVGADTTFHCIVMFFGKRDGKMTQQGKSCLFNALKRDIRTISAIVTPPEFEDGPVKCQVYFYRHKSKGELFLESFDFGLAETVADGADVTGKLEGVLPPLTRPFTAWEYADRSDPARYSKPKMRLRFFDPKGAAQPTTETRQGGADF